MRSKSSLIYLSYVAHLASLTSAQSQDSSDELVTLYGVSLKPAPSDSPSSIDRMSPDEILNANIPLAGSIKDASAVGIDVSGGTIYVGIHEYSVTVSTTSGQLTTVTLPSPTSETVTLIARPSGFYHRDYGVTISNNQGTYEGNLDFFCENDIREGVPPEDGTVVCRKALPVRQGNAGNVSTATIEATTIGQAVPIATITPPPEDSVLPTLGLQETGFSTIIRQPEGTGEAQMLMMGWMWAR